MWGTILAVWGTGALVATTARQLDIHSAGRPGLQLGTASLAAARSLYRTRQGRHVASWEPASCRLPASHLEPGRACPVWLPLLPCSLLTAAARRRPSLPAAEEAPSRLRTLFAPVAEALEARLAPLRGTMSIGAIAGDAMREEAAQSEMVKRLRTRLMSHD